MVIELIAHIFTSFECLDRNKGKPIKFLSFHDWMSSIHDLRALPTYMMKICCRWKLVVITTMLLLSFGSLVSIYTKISVSDSLSPTFDSGPETTRQKLERSCSMFIHDRTLRISMTKRVFCITAIILQQRAFHWQYQDSCQHLHREPFLSHLPTEEKLCHRKSCEDR